ncbi:MAG: LamG-like jellyroll fold domain-containing protein [Limisphaerales bacterium]
MDPERLEQLLQRHWDQVLTPAERIELERELLASSRARSAYWESARWHALIRQWGEAQWGRLEAESLTPNASSTLGPSADVAEVASVAKVPRDSDFGAVPSVSYRLTWLLAGLVVALVGVLAFRGLFPSPSARPAPPGTAQSSGSPPTPSSADPSSTGIALLTRTFDAEWPEPVITRHTGELLNPGRIRFRSGIVEIETLRGARLVIEGPADVELAAQNEVILHHGIVRAHVPETARGLSVRSARFQLIDRAAVFGCVVSESGEAEVHVFQGTVELSESKLGTVHTLSAGNALQLADSGTRDVPADPTRFMADAELNRRADELARQQLADWREFGRTLDQRPDLLVRLDFQDARKGARTLSNRAVHAPASSGASLVGCDWVDGRWPGKGAVEFRHQNDRLWLNVSGVLNAATFLAWVRVDSLPYSLHALLSAEGPGGKIRWALAESGALSFGIQIPNDGRGWLIHRSRLKVRPQQLGTWLCLVTVLSADGTVTHYLNGENAGEGRLIERTPGKLGHCEIGNSAAPPPTPGSAPASAPTSTAPAEPNPGADRPRNFVGRMDEFAIFSAGLAPDEVRWLHTVGRTGRRATGSPNVGAILPSVPKSESESANPTAGMPSPSVLSPVPPRP